MQLNLEAPKFTTLQLSYLSQEQKTPVFAMFSSPPVFVRVPLQISGGEHCRRELAVEVWRGTLPSGAGGEARRGTLPSGAHERQ